MPNLVAAKPTGTVCFKSPLYRSNMQYRVILKTEKKMEIIERMVTLILQNYKNQSGIIYCLSKSVSEVWNMYSAAEPYILFHCLGYTDCCTKSWTIKQWHDQNRCVQCKYSWGWEAEIAWAMEKRGSSCCMCNYRYGALSFILLVYQCLQSVYLTSIWLGY